MKCSRRPEKPPPTPSPGVRDAPRPRSRAIASTARARPLPFRARVGRRQEGSLGRQICHFCSISTTRNASNPTNKPTTLDTPPPAAASAHFPKFVHHFSNHLLRTSESHGH